MDSLPSFIKLRIAATQAAVTQYGQAEQDSVKQAFDAVGIGYQCTAAPTSYPNYAVEDFLCAGRFNVTWPAMSRVNRYIAQTTPVNVAWTFALTTTDGDVTQCFTQVGSPSYYRMRACNNCGCGPWSPNYYMAYWSPCA